VHTGERFGDADLDEIPVVPAGLYIITPEAVAAAE